MSLKTSHVDPMRASSVYRKGASAQYPNGAWEGQNPGEYQKWVGMCAAIDAGGNPARPVMASSFGKALVGWWTPKAALPDPFEGFVCFTADRPLDLIAWGLAARFDAILLKGDGTDAAKPGDAEKLLAAGCKRVLEWWSWDPPLVGVFGSKGRVLQDEGPGQREASERISRPKATVTNNWAATVPSGCSWYFAESDWSNNPSNGPVAAFTAAKNRGAPETKISPTYYLGGAKTLQEFEQAWGGKCRAIFRGELLSVAERDYLRSTSG